MRTTELRSYLRWLRREWPAMGPVKVLQVGSNKDWYGWLHRRTHGFTLRLAAGMSDADVRETLLHEWAHILAYPKQDLTETEGEHDSLFCSTYIELETSFQGAFPNAKLRKDIVGYPTLTITKIKIGEALCCE